MPFASDVDNNVMVSANTGSDTVTVYKNFKSLSDNQAADAVLNYADSGILAPRDLKLSWGGFSSPGTFTTNTPPDYYLFKPGSGTSMYALAVNQRQQERGYFPPRSIQCGVLASYIIVNGGG